MNKQQMMQFPVFGNRVDWDRFFTEPQVNQVGAGTPYYIQD